MQKQLEATYAHIDNSAASFFTKEDVKTLLKGFAIRLEEAQQAEQNKALTSEYVLDQLDSLQAEVVDILRGFDYDDSATVDLSGREITLDFDSSYVEEAVERVFNQYVDSLKQGA